ncbi:hypothetical protein NESM_000497600 [Novymonas esmeraldas]|uniref:Crescentin n=1 Tax=Novymonas esmeraldas TaxID=1808958 RepID=A0AAW0ESN8_9TRYP
MAEAEGAAFSTLCDRLLHDHPGNRAVEDVVIKLEVAHTQHVNAVKRGFNEDLTRLERESKEDCDRRESRAAEDAAYHASQLARTTADFERQLAVASDTYRRDLERVKLAYESLLEDGKRRTAMVAQIHDDHARELKRTKDESERIIGNKDKEIARLNRKLEEEALLTRQMLAEADEQRRLIEDDGAMLRSKLLDNEVLREKAEMLHREEVMRLMSQQENIIRTSTYVLNQFQNRSADLEVELSRVRAMMFDQEYQSFRAKLRDDAFKVGAVDLHREMDALDARKERDRRALGDVLERVAAAKESQEETLRQYQVDLQAEMAKLREAQRLKEEKGESLHLKLPSGASVTFKTRSTPRRSPSKDENISNNLSVEINGRE